MAKHQPTPTAAITTPASAGPRIRAVLNRLELSAIAFGSSSRPTSWIVRFWRAGRSNTTRGAGEERDRVDLPHLDVPEQRDRGEHPGEDHLHRLRHDHDATVVEAVGDDAGEEPEERERPEAGEREKPDARAASA